MPILEEDLLKYKRDMQEAFQKGYEADYGKTTNIIWPEADIERSLTTNGAITDKAVVDGKIVSGAIVVIDEIVQHNHLDFLYVKYGTQSKGIGKMMWEEIASPYQGVGNLHPIY